MKQNAFFSIRLIVFAILACGCGQEALASSWWLHQKPRELTRNSSLILRGRIDSEYVFHADEVLKGESRLYVLNLSEVATSFAYRRSDLSRDTDLQVGEETILFLHDDSDSLHIVANGMFRIAGLESRSGVVGYAQFISKCNYLLQSEILYKDLNALARIVKEELIAIESDRDAAFQQFEKATSNSELTESIDKLLAIARFDVPRLQAKAIERITARDDGSLSRAYLMAHFIKKVGHADGARYLEEMHERHPGSVRLREISALGSSRSLAFLKTVFDRAESREHKVYALAQMTILYSRLERKGDFDACDEVRETIYRLVDQAGSSKSKCDQYVYGVSKVTHPTSLKKLIRFREKLSESEYKVPQELESAIGELEQRLAQRGEIEPATPAGAADQPAMR